MIYVTITFSYFVVSGVTFKLFMRQREGTGKEDLELYPLPVIAAVLWPAFLPAMIGSWLIKGESND